MQKIISTKTIGVVIPIYNVEKYLKECLDSVINQTYTNLEIILVNDGSTDENSLNIAKEYTLKDKRIILFDKKNGGLSSARNLGIEYFSREYKLKNKTQTIKENSLIEFNIDGNNPYEVYTVYKSYKAFNNEQDLTKFTYPIIDYIIFLDSDDYWELNCIEECVPRMNGVDVVWFDTQVFLDGIDFSNWKSNIKWLDFKQEVVIDKDDWLKRMYDYKMKWFYFSWQGMINFNFLKNIKLKFIDYIVQEDDHFGILLFSQMKYCYILPRELYFYRIRSNSIMAYQGKITSKNIPMFFQEYLHYFNDDAVLTRNYFHTSSHVKTCIALLDFFKKQNDKVLTKSLFKYLLPTYIKNAYEIIHFSKDPLDLLSNVGMIKNYMQEYNIKPHGVEFRFKNELAYKTGGTILKSCKSWREIFGLPISICKIIKQDKNDKILFKKRIERNPYAVLPQMSEYEDDYKIEHLKKHLTYKIGVAFLKWHNYRYIGGYFGFLFATLKIFIEHSYKKNKKNNLLVDLWQADIGQKISHMDFEIKKIGETLRYNLESINHKLSYFGMFGVDLQNSLLGEEDMKLIYARLKEMRIPCSLYKDILCKKCIFIDTSGQYIEMCNFLSQFDNIKLYVFEPNLLIFSLLERQKKYNFNIFNFSLGCEANNKNILKKDLVLLLNNQESLEFVSSEIKDIQKFIKEVCLDDYELKILRLKIDKAGWYFLNKIIEKRLYMQFSFVICDFFEDYFKEIYRDLLEKEIQENS
ncbi:glycosyltransferase family 2 protein, partial [Campylobacter jejuni]|nr:glycosyltransferase family 2 protein [Campylobacter jejuni]